MKSKTFSVIVAATITLTLFVAIAVCVLNPFNESNKNLPAQREEREEFSTPPEPQMRPEGKVDEHLDSSEENSKVELLLADGEFQRALSKTLEKKLGDEKVAESLSKSIMETEEFKKQVSSYLAGAENEADSNSISLPYPGGDGSHLSDEEYASRREESRSSEIEKVLKYMGY